MKTYAILGYPVSHSFSPKLHNTVFKELQLTDREYVYCDTAPKDLQKRIHEMRKGAWDGFSVTIPHKKTVIPFLDELTERAQKVGAVNTIVRKVGAEGSVRLVGDNTDYVGFKKSLEEVGITEGENSFPRPEAKALVLGSGGAAQAIIAVLADHGFQVSVASRNPAGARQGASLQRGMAVTLGYDELDPKDNWKLIVNTTPVGMHPNVDACVLTDPSWFTADRTYVDIIYNPKTTQFLIQAKKAGAQIVCGDRMFLWQAVEQSRAFTGGMEPPVKLMESLLCS
ncbi:MAG: shikimate dehydrogenase [Candidatus Gracilibacteria bacterium]|nr:shikimate dehydrogenase [Candidatus Gracilibacteria bacterium]